MQTQEFSLEWIEDGKVICMRLFDISTREKADRYLDAIEENNRNWNPERPLFMIFDASQVIKDTWTPYIRQRSQQAFSALPLEVKGRLASVLKKSILLQIVKLFLERGLNRQNRPIQLKIFFDWDEAMEWLKQDSYWK